MCLIVDTQNWHKQDKGQNSQFNINSYYFCKFGMYDCCAEDREIVLGYSRHDFINEPKKNSKQN